MAGDPFILAHRGNMHCLSDRIHGNALFILGEDGPLPRLVPGDDQNLFVSLTPTKRPALLARQGYGVLWGRGGFVEGNQGRALMPVSASCRHASSQPLATMQT